MTQAKPKLQPKTKPAKAAATSAKPPVTTTAATTDVVRDQAYVVHLAALKAAGAFTAEVLCIVPEQVAIHLVWLNGKPALLVGELEQALRWPTLGKHIAEADCLQYGRDWLVLGREWLPKLRRALPMGLAKEFRWLRLLTVGGILAMTTQHDVMRRLQTSTAARNNLNDIATAALRRVLDATAAFPVALVTALDGGRVSRMLDGTALYTPPTERDAFCDPTRAPKTLPKAVLDGLVAGKLRAAKSKLPSSLTDAQVVSLAKLFDWAPAVVRHLQRYTPRELQREVDRRITAGTLSVDRLVGICQPTAGNGEWPTV